MGMVRNQKQKNSKNKKKSSRLSIMEMNAIESRLNTDASVVVLQGSPNRYLIMKGEDKGLILTEEDFKKYSGLHTSIINRFNTKPVTKDEKDSLEEELEAMIVKAERLIEKPDLPLIIAHHNLMESKLQEAVELNFYNLAAYYIDLANLQRILVFHYEKEIDEQIEYYYKLAIKIRPNSQNARAGLAQYYMRRNLLTTALKYLSEMSDGRIVAELLEAVASDSRVVFSNQESNYEALKLIEQVYPENAMLDLIHIYLYCSIGDLSNLEQRYDVFMDRIDKRMTHTFGISNLRSLREIKLTAILNLMNLIACFTDTKFSTEKRNEFIDRIIRDGEKLLPKHKEFYDMFQSNKCAALLVKGEYQTVVDILSRQVKVKPNNLDFSNLAFAYYFLGDFENSKYNADKAATIVVDEQILNLLVILAYIQKDYDRALEYSLQSKAYISSDSNKVLTFKDNDGTLMKSGMFSNPSGGDTVFLQKTMVNVFITHGYYEAALEAIEDLLLKKPHEMEFMVLKANIVKLLEADNETEKKIQELKNKYQNAQNDLEKKVKIQNQMKSFLNTFIGLQSPHENEELTDEELSQFLSNIQTHIKELVNTEHNPKLNEKVRELEEDLKNQFNQFENFSIEQLSLAEALFEEFDYTPLDYGMLAVIYGKVLEIELQRLLYVKNYTHLTKERNGKTIKEKINWEKGISIAQCRDILIRNPIPGLRNIEVMLETVRQARNASAHTGSCDLGTIIKVRDYLYEQKWLERLNAEL